MKPERFGQAQETIGGSRSCTVQANTCRTVKSPWEAGSSNYLQQLAAVYYIGVILLNFFIRKLGMRCEEKQPSRMSSVFGFVAGVVPACNSTSVSRSRTSDLTHVMTPFKLVGQLLALAQAVWESIMGY